jgi:hypothetical protein
MNSQTALQITPEPRHRHRRPGKAKQLTLFTVLPACVAAAAVWGLCDLIDGASPEAPQVAAQQVPAPAPALSDRTVHTVGQVVAISPESITTRSTDGITTTFAITPNTTQINTDGPGPGSAFAVDETVAVLGVVNNGTPVATALAEQDAAVGTAPPMDG